MNHFFECECDPQEAMLWLAEALSEVNPSAFVSYTQQQQQQQQQQPIIKSIEERGSSMNVPRNLNVNKRIIEFLKRNWAPQVHDEKERVFKHMINERMRRGKQKENYLALHKSLPLGTKGDKNSIVQMAIRRIEELEKCKNELKRENHGLEMKLQHKKNNNGSSREVDRAHIRLNVVCPSSGIDSMLEALKCLKNTSDTKAIAIQSSFSAQRFSARFEIKTKIGAAEVENIIKTTLWEAEKKYRINSQEI